MFTPAKRDESSINCYEKARGKPIKQSITWTNEKHNLYLRHLEASFVNQLRGLTGLLGTHSEKREFEPNSIRKVPTNTCDNFPHQFTVVHSGRWRKKKFESNELFVSAAADSRVIPENRWINHFRLAGELSIVNSDAQEKISPSSNSFQSKKRNFSPKCPEQRFADHQDSAGSVSEVSGQNFEDDDHPKSQSSGSSVTKRLKVEAAEPSSNDQVVPSQANTHQ